MSLKTFLTRYAGEALGVASALTTMLEGLALSPKQSETVNAVIAKLTKASESILDGIDTVKETVVKIDAKDVAKAVTSYMADHPVTYDQAALDKAVADAVAVAMRDYTAPPVQPVA
jgi:predicted transcriptional regulator